MLLEHSWSILKLKTQLIFDLRKLGPMEVWKLAMSIFKWRKLEGNQTKVVMFLLTNLLKYSLDKAMDYRSPNLELSASSPHFSCLI